MRFLTTVHTSRLYVLILLKTVQRLGYFPMLAEVPPPIVSFLTKAVGTQQSASRQLQSEEKSNTRQRAMEAIRTFLKIQPVSADTDCAMHQAAKQAAQTKLELADIINVMIEELVRQRFELPAFSRLNRIAQRVRNHVNEQYFSTLTAPLPAQVLEQFDAMLTVTRNQLTSGWQQLKQEPKKPTNTEVRQYLDHVKWLKSWATELPAGDHIPGVKRNQYVHEARALDAADMKTTQTNKRYALMVLLFHAQLGSSQKTENKAR